MSEAPRKRPHWRQRLDLRWIENSEAATALEVAAAGGHSLLLVGPTGTGKTLLLHTFATLLPPLSDREASAVDEIYARTAEPSPVPERPFQCPDPMFGGKFFFDTEDELGQVTLAHNGVLLLDDIAHLVRRTLDRLDQVLLERHTNPSALSCQLVGALALCPCGRLGLGRASCRCEEAAIDAHYRSVPASFVDSMALVVRTEPVPPSVVSVMLNRRTSEDARERIARARAIQERRFADSFHPPINALMGFGEMTQFCRLDRPTIEWFDACYARGRHLVTTRGVHETLRVARTFADLEGCAVIRRIDLTRALELRSPNLPYEAKLMWRD